MNYFEFYGIPVSFKVDEAQLKRIFYQNSKKYHPDFHTLSDDSQQEEALQLSTFNNNAWNTLSDFDKRIQYILEIKGMMAEEGSQKLSQEFLMDMMDINEQVMELEFDFDENTYQSVRKSVENIDNQIFASVSPILENWQDVHGTEEDLIKVKDFFLKKKYLLRILENLSKFAPA